MPIATLLLDTPTGTREVRTPFEGGHLMSDFSGGKATGVLRIYLSKDSSLALDTQGVDGSHIVSVTLPLEEKARERAQQESNVFGGHWRALLTPTCLTLTGFTPGEDAP